MSEGRTTTVPAATLTSTTRRSYSRHREHHHMHHADVTLLQDSRFSCNICLEAVTDPVVTQCGHLYCWPCLYRWLEPGMLPGERQSLIANSTSNSGSNASLYQHGMLPAIDETRRVCPVCKAPCSVPSIVPIYVRNDDPPGVEEKEGIQYGNSLSSSLEEDDDGIEIDDDFPDIPVVAGQDDVPGTNSQDQEVVDDDENQADAEFEEEEEDVEPSMSLNYSSSMDQTVDQTATSTSGLRQRIRFRSRDSDIPPTAVVSQQSSGSNNNNNNHEGSSTTVPARPAANSPTRVNDSSSRNNNNNNNNSNRRGGGSGSSSPPSPPRTAIAGMTPLSPAAAHPASLSHGLVLSFQQVMRQHQHQLVPTGTATAGASEHYIPPLHRREGHGNAVLMHQQQYLGESDPDATEFLSRILLLLGSFVILCLLLF